MPEYELSTVLSWDLISRGLGVPLYAFRNFVFELLPAKSILLRYISLVIGNTLLLYSMRMHTDVFKHFLSNLYNLQLLQMVYKS
jgi:hypothetical protein